jgi:hypothetical protein
MDVPAGEYEITGKATTIFDSTKAVRATLAPSGVYTLQVCFMRWSGYDDLKEYRNLSRLEAERSARQV